MLGRVDQAGRHRQQGEDGENHSGQLQMVPSDILSKPDARGYLESFECFEVHQETLEAQEPQQAQIDQEVVLQHLAPERQNRYKVRRQGQDGQQVDNYQRLDQVRQPQPIAVPPEQIFEQEKKSDAILGEIHYRMDRRRQPGQRPRGDEYRRQQNQQGQFEFHQRCR